MINVRPKLLAVFFLLIVFTFSIIAILIYPTVFLNNVVSIIAILSGISSILISLQSSSIAELEAVKEYFFQSDSAEITEARHNIYKNSSENINEDDMRTMCNFFEFWGMMTRKNYLPIWIFDNAAGLSVLKVFNKAEIYINNRRKDNALYANNFVWLIKQIEKRNKEAVKLSKVYGNKKIN